MADPVKTPTQEFEAWLGKQSNPVKDALKPLLPMLTQYFAEPGAVSLISSTGEINFTPFLQSKTTTADAYAIEQVKNSMAAYETAKTQNPGGLSGNMWSLILGAGLVGVGFLTGLGPLLIAALGVLGLVGGGFMDGAGSVVGDLFKVPPKTLPVTLPPVKAGELGISLNKDNDRLKPGEKEESRFEGVQVGGKFKINTIHVFKDGKATSEDVSGKNLELDIVNLQVQFDKTKNTDVVAKIEEMKVGLAILPQRINTKGDMSFTVNKNAAGTTSAIYDPAVKVEIDGKKFTYQARLMDGSISGDMKKATFKRLVLTDEKGVPIKVKDANGKVTEIELKSTTDPLKGWEYPLDKDRIIEASAPYVGRLTDFTKIAKESLEAEHKLVKEAMLNDPASQNITYENVTSNSLTIKITPVGTLGDKFSTVRTLDCKIDEHGRILATGSGLSIDGVRTSMAIGEYYVGNVEMELVPAPAAPPAAGAAPAAPAAQTFRVKLDGDKKPTIDFLDPSRLGEAFKGAEKVHDGNSKIGGYLTKNDYQYNIDSKNSGELPPVQVVPGKAKSFEEKKSADQPQV